MTVTDRLVCILHGPESIRRECARSANRLPGNHADSNYQVHRQYSSGAARSHFQCGFDSAKGNIMYVRKTLRQVVAAALLGMAAASSQASLLYVGPVPDTGSGFGNVETILTLASDNTTGSSAGAVTRVGGSDVEIGTVQPGAVHNATYSFGALNITDAADLLFIFNPAEPGNADNSILLNSLVLSIYSDNGGAPLFSATLVAPVFFPSTDPGIGNSGFGFALDATQAALAQAFVSATNRIGLAASVSLATGGPDTFFVLVRDEPGNPVPEPASALLLGAGMAGMWAVRRRRNRP